MLDSTHLTQHPPLIVRPASCLALPLALAARPGSGGRGQIIVAGGREVVVRCVDDDGRIEDVDEAAYALGVTLVGLGVCGLVLTAGDDAAVACGVIRYGHGQVGLTQVVDGEARLKRCVRERLV